MFATLFAIPNNLHASCGLDGAVFEQIRRAENRESLRALAVGVSLKGSCAVCHLVRVGGPRNEYGNAINTLLRLSQGARDDYARQREAAQRVKDIPANPSLAHSPTFGELFEQGRFPARSLTRQDLPLPQIPANDADITLSHNTASENVTLPQVRELVQNVESKSPFGILQLSKTHEITPAIAEVLAEFRGEMLILGLRSLSPEVAAALAKSQAATLWLHSVTSLSPQAAEAISRFPGHLVLTGLTELDSMPLTEKLAAQSSPLSFPYLTTISPEIAAGLAKNERSLTLAGLTDVSLDVQEALANTVGSLSMPYLTSLDSLALARKLASSVVLLPKVQKLSPEQMEGLLEAKFQGSLFGGIYLSHQAVTMDVAKVLAENPSKINLTLVGKGPLPAEVLRALLKSRQNLTLPDVEELDAEQIRIVAEELPSRLVRPGVVANSALILPNLKRLDSPLLAETLGKANGFSFPGVAQISPEAAAALGVLPDGEAIGPEMKKIIVPSGSLSFPNLQELSPETAQLLMNKRWASISLPALEDVSLETLSLIASQTSRLTLGLTSLPIELADALAEIRTYQPMAGDAISFPYLSDLSPEAARVLVSSLNRGFRDVPTVARFSNSPMLSFGRISGFATLSPELAVELAKYEGNLEIDGLGELPAESAAALASYPGPRLSLSGPVLEGLSPEAAASLVNVSAGLHIPLRHLDSQPLADRIARERGNSMLYNLETVSREAAPSLTQYHSFFDLRALQVLDSPEIARRLVEGATAARSVTLPALSQITSECAEVLASGSKTLFIGLTVFDSPETARALAKSRSQVILFRLRAATPEVIKILQDAKSIETPPLDSLYILSNSRLE